MHNGREFFRSNECRILHYAQHVRHGILRAQLGALYFAYVEPRGRRWPRSYEKIANRRQSVPTPQLNSRPQLAAGCRLNNASESPRVLLMPERTLRVSGPSLDIISRCDGKHTVSEIVSALQKLYSKADPKKVESDVLEYLARLHDDQAIEFTTQDASGSGGTQ
jgi:pyrroloquinoline quinone biosynthesis protein D